MQSQNHWMVKLGRDLCEVRRNQKSPVSTLLLKEGHLGPVTHICTQKKVLDYVRGWSLHYPFGQPVLVLSHHHSNKMLAGVKPLIFLERVSRVSSSITFPGIEGRLTSLSFPGSIFLPFLRQERH